MIASNWNVSVIHDDAKRAQAAGAAIANSKGAAMQDDSSSVHSAASGSDSRSSSLSKAASGAASETTSSAEQTVRFSVGEETNPGISDETTPGAAAQLAPVRATLGQWQFSSRALLSATPSKVWKELHKNKQLVDTDTAKSLLIAMEAVAAWKHYKSSGVSTHAHAKAECAFRAARAHCVLCAICGL
jgi:hypothetical protein